MLDINTTISLGSASSYRRGRSFTGGRAGRMRLDWDRSRSVSTGRGSRARVSRRWSAAVDVVRLIRPAPEDPCDRGTRTGLLGLRGSVAVPVPLLSLLLLLVLVLDLMLVLRLRLRLRPLFTSLPTLPPPTRVDRSDMEPGTGGRVEVGFRASSCSGGEVVTVWRFRAVRISSMPWDRRDRGEGRGRDEEADKEEEEANCGVAARGAAEEGEYETDAGGGWAGIDSWRDLVDGRLEDGEEYAHDREARRVAGECGGEHEDERIIFQRGDQDDEEQKKQTRRNATIRNNRLSRARSTTCASGDRNTHSAGTRGRR